MQVEVLAFFIDWLALQKQHDIWRLNPHFLYYFSFEHLHGWSRSNHELNRFL